MLYNQWTQVLTPFKIVFSYNDLSFLSTVFSALVKSYSRCIMGIEMQSAANNLSPEISCQMGNNSFLIFSLNKISLSMTALSLLIFPLLFSCQYYSVYVLPFHYSVKRKKHNWHKYFTSKNVYMAHNIMPQCTLFSVYFTDRFPLARTLFPLNVLILGACRIYETPVDNTQSAMLCF